MQSQYLIGLLFSAQLFTLCKCSTDNMVSVDHTKWMLSASWDFTIDHGDVYWASRLPVDCSGVRVFTIKRLWTVLYNFQQ